MTTVTMSEYNDNVVFIAEGHSGYGDRGSDIVCAGISSIIYAFVNTVLDDEASDRLYLKRKIVRDGYVYIEFEPFDFSKERTKGITDTCLTGLEMLGEAYPEYLKIN